MYFKNSEIVWTPILHGVRQIVGVNLDGSFSLQCKNRKLTSEENSRMYAWIWDRAKPIDWNDSYIPSGIFVMHEDSLLLQELHLAHGGSSGKWLSAERHNLNSLSRERARDTLTYSMHHAEPYDMPENSWLEYTFSLWVRYAQFLLNEEK